MSPTIDLTEEMVSVSVGTTVQLSVANASLSFWSYPYPLLDMGLYRCSDPSFCRFSLILPRRSLSSEIYVQGFQFGIFKTFVGARRVVAGRISPSVSPCRWVMFQDVSVVGFGVFLVSIVGSQG